MKEIEAQGKNVEEAINSGLKMLGATLDEVDIKILNEGGLFRKAKVLLIRSDEPDAPVKAVEVKPEENKAPVAREEVGKEKQKPKQMEIVSVIEPIEAAPANELDEEEVIASGVAMSTPRMGAKREIITEREMPQSRNLSDKEKTQIETFVKDFLKALNAEVEVEISESETAVMFSLVGENASSVIGHRGECLQAIQTLVAAYMRRHDIRGAKALINTGNYRERREETLRSMARRMADKVVNTGKSVRMDPMNAYERRIVHDEISGNKQITTESQGGEPRRFIVIKPNRNY